LGLAAEVLEVRCLLSSAAAVGHALHGAAQAQSHHLHTTPAPGFSFNGLFSGTLSIPEFNNFSRDVAGSLTISKTTLQPGSSFKVKLAVPAIFGSAISGVKGTFAGTVSNVQSSGSDQIITINPSTKNAGSVVVSFTLGGVKLSPKATPANSPFTLTIDSHGHILSYSGTYAVPAIPGVTAAGNATFTFTMD
jgi:hypothetical protein